jgi:hypothetical protein
MTAFGYPFDCLNPELLRVPLPAHSDLLSCRKSWLEDVYEKLAGPQTLKCLSTAHKPRKKEA